MFFTSNQAEHESQHFINESLEDFSLFNDLEYVSSSRYFHIITSGKKVGVIIIMKINRLHRRAELKTIIFRTYQGKGYMCRAVKLALDYSFCTLNMNKIYLGVDSENLDEIYMYNKLNFEIEGKLKNEIYANGNYRNVVRMCVFQDVYFSKS